MNCRSAQRLLSAERDGALEANEHAALAGHLAECAGCRRANITVNAAVENWRAATTGAKAPDAERAWQDINREIRLGRAAEVRSPLVRWMLPLGAAAALVAIAAVFTPRWTGEQTPSIARVETARADFVEVPNDVSSMVYVDGQSGWLVVWAVDNPRPTRL